MHIGFIGAGKVGQTLARLLYQAGYTIGAIHSRTPSRAKTLARQVNSTVTNDPYQVLEVVDLTLLTVPDDAIEPLAKKLAWGDLTGKAVAHTSGAHDARVLAALADRGAMVGSIHPAYPFASVETALAGLPGSTFAVEAKDEQLAVSLGEIVQALKGSILTILPGDKAAYHAALVLASNYTVTLYAVAEQLLLTLSDDRAAIDRALNTLVGATVANIQQQGVPAALTGPLVRGDALTIAAHLQALDQRDAQVAAIYRDLARLSFPMLATRGVQTEAIEHLLGRDRNDATDDT